MYNLVQFVKCARLPSMDDRRAATRERILTAATTLISRYGFKRASVAATAAGAGIAKPTLYAYFDDKAAIFRAVCECVLDAIVDDARRAAARDGPLDERVGAVLSAKFTRLYELVHATPHAGEII